MMKKNWTEKAIDEVINFMEKKKSLSGSTDCTTARNLKKYHTLKKTKKP